MNDNICQKLIIKDSTFLNNEDIVILQSGDLYIDNCNYFLLIPY